MKKKLLSAVALALVSAFFLATAACSANRLPDERELSAQEYSILNTVGRDSLGRYSAPSDSVKKDKDRYVGLFYFLIHNNRNVRIFGDRFFGVGLLERTII